MAGVSLADARRVIAAAEKKAQEIGQPMNIAVADEGGNIVSHVRMDDAWIGSIDISMKKAFTSRAFDIATKDLATHSQSGGQFFGIHVSNRWPDHDLRRRHSAEARRQGRRRDRRQRRLGRAGPRGGRGRRGCILAFRDGGAGMGAQDSAADDHGAEQQQHAQNVGVQHGIAQQDSDQTKASARGAEGEVQALPGATGETQKHQQYRGH